MAIQLKRGSGAPGSLEDGELAVDLTNLNLYAGSSGVNQLTEALVARASTDTAVVSWDTATGKFVERTGLRITGSLTEAYQNFRFRDGVYLRFGTGNDVDLRFNGTDMLTNIPAGARWEFSNPTGDILNLRSDNNIEIGGTTIYTDALNTAKEFNKGFERIEVLSQASYDALSGSRDSNTVYLING